MSAAAPLRRNDMRRHLSGPLKLTTVELPLSLVARARAFARDRQIPLRSLLHNALSRYLDSESPSR